jgi:hypothetical protein
VAEYAVLFSLVNSRSTVHAKTCGRVKAARTSQSHGITLLVAATARQAADKYNAEANAQGIPRASICKCAK